MAKNKKAAVLEPEQVAIGDLTPHPKNYRTHPPDQLEHIVASIKASGFYRNVVATKDGTILAGHGVVAAAAMIGMTEVPVVRLPLDADHPAALKILAGDNYVSHLAHNDDRALTELLKGIAEEDDLLGTGFDEKMLAALAMVTRHGSELSDTGAAQAWAGMPEFDPGSEEISAKVKFLTKEDRTKFLEVLGIDESVVAQRVGGFSFWWPERERNDLSAVQFVDDGEAASAEEPKT